MIDPADGSVDGSFSLESLGVTTASRPWDADSRGLIVTPADGSGLQNGYDAEIYPAIGKEGLGGIDVSLDGSEAWVMNLFDRSVYRIDLDGSINVDPTSSPVSGDILGFAMPLDLISGCVADDVRPWAVRYKSRTEVLVGAVCSAESTQERNALSAAVLALNPVDGKIGRAHV